MTPTILKASMIVTLVATMLAASSSAADHLAQTDSDPAPIQTLPFELLPHLA